jgi:hypothetical protein
VEGKAPSGYKVEYSVNGATYTTTAPTAAPVDGTVRIRVSRSGYRERVYTVAIAKPGPGTGTLWEEIEKIDITIGSIPQFGVNYSDLVIYVKAAYQDQIASITVRNRSAEKQSGSPETWTVSAEGHLALSDLVYSDIVVTRLSTPGALPEEIERVVITTGSVPQFSVDYSDLVIYIKAAYQNQIASITVGDKNASKQSGTPETWTVSVDGHVTQAQLSALIRVNRTGGSSSREEITITPSPGSWPAPIQRVTKQDASVPQFGVPVTDVRVYVSDTVAGVQIKGKDASYTGGAWVASFNENADGFTLSTSQVQVLGYNGPGTSEPTGKQLSIKSFNVGYDYTGGGYVGFINLEISGDLNVQSIRVTDDATGAVLAEYPGGALSRINAYQYNGLIEAVAGASSAEMSANAAPLKGKEVTVTVTSVSGDAKSLKATYQYES